MFPLQRDDVTFGEERHVGSILYNITHEKSTPPPRVHAWTQAQRQLPSIKKGLEENFTILKALTFRTKTP